VGGGIERRALRAGVGERADVALALVLGSFTEEVDTPDLIEAKGAAR
jgi:hypothetical protein